jgi:hypothetical protein
MSTKSYDEPAAGAATEEPRVPHGAQHCADVHEGLKMVASLMDGEQGVLEHDGVKKLHAKLRPLLDQHMGRYAGLFAKEWPELEPIGEGEESESVETEAEGGEEGGEKKPVAEAPEEEHADDEDEEEEDASPKGGRVGKTKGGKVGAAKSMSKKSLGMVKDASEWLDDHSGEDNLTKGQRAAAKHHAACLKSMCAAKEDALNGGEAVEDDMGPEEKGMILDSLKAVKAEIAAGKALLARVTGRE